VIPPGIDIPLLVSVFAPATAPAGQVDVLTLDATNVSSVAGGPSTSVSFQSDVINGQVRLTKTAAVDVGCDGLALSAFQAVQNTEVEPEDCIVWRVVAENQGDVDATNVVITDSAPAFSTLEASSLAYCLTNDCTPTTVDVPATVVGSAIIFYIGEDPVVGTTGGKLVPGQKATAQFSVKVE